MLSARKISSTNPLSEKSSKMVVPLLIFFAAFLFISIVQRIAGVHPLDAYSHMFAGAFGSWTKMAHALNVWVPLTLCACGLLYTFKIGLWNIGVEGQVMMGAVLTTGVIQLGSTGPLSAMPGLLLFLSFIGGMIGGVMWASGVAYLKVRCGVDEIFGGLGLNFVAQSIILWLVFGPWKRPGVASMSGTDPFPPEFWLPYLSHVRLSPVGIGIAVFSLILTFIILRYMRIGFAFIAVGGNPKAAYLFGLNPSRNLLYAMMIAGGFAGLAGSVQVTGVYHRLLPAISSNYGYLGLLVTMLAGYRIRYTPLVAFFFACLNVGSIQLPMALSLDSSLAGVIQGVLVLMVLGMKAWQEKQKKPYR